MCRPLHGTTDIWARRHGKLIEVRTGYAFPLMKCYSIGMNPFDPDFKDNYIRGIGTTVEVALRVLEREAKKMAETYWM